MFWIFSEVVFVEVQNSSIKSLQMNPSDLKKITKIARTFL